jgi:uncharacterized metal-binding protein
VQLAKSGRPVVALDGCPLHCVRNCLVRHGVAPKLHLTLTKLGFKKRFRMEFDEDQAVTVFRGVVAVLEGGPQSELVVACLEDPSAEAVQREMPQMQASR